MLPSHLGLSENIGIQSTLILPYLPFCTFDPLSHTPADCLSQHITHITAQHGTAQHYEVKYACTHAALRHKYIFFLHSFCILAFLDQHLPIPYPHPLHVFARLFLASPLAVYVYIHLYLTSEVACALDGWRMEKEVKHPLFCSDSSDLQHLLAKSNPSSLFGRPYLTIFHALSQ